MSMWNIPLRRMLPSLWFPPVPPFLYDYLSYYINLQRLTIVPHNYWFCGTRRHLDRLITVSCGFIVQNIATLIVNNSLKNTAVSDVLIWPLEFGRMYFAFWTCNLEYKSVPKWVQRTICNSSYLYRKGYFKAGRSASSLLAV